MRDLVILLIRRDYKVTQCLRTLGGIQVTIIQRYAIEPPRRLPDISQDSRYAELLLFG
jgi:hypothetical protein